MIKLGIAIFHVLLATQAGPPANGKLAYVHNGNIWVKTLPNGVPQQISQGGGAESPQWSPSGQWLAFQQGRKTIVASISGGRQEFDSRQTAWSPVRDELGLLDENGLAVIAVGGNEIQKRVVFRNSQTAGVAGFAWNPDAGVFALSVITPDPGGRPEFRVGHLWRINVDGTQQRELFTPKERGGVEPAGWSSDGQDIIFRADPDFSASVASDGLPLFSIPGNGGAPQQLASQVLAPPDFLAISSLKRQVLIVTGGGRETWTNKRLVMSDPSTGRVTELTDQRSVALSPAWSADGIRIAYVGSPDNKESQRVNVGTVLSPNGKITVQPVQSGRDEPKTTLNQRRIWMIGADGKARQLTLDSRYRDEYPRWSADGRFLVFIRVDQQDKASVWTLALDNSAPQKAVDDIALPSTGWFGYYGNIEWSKYVAWHSE